MQTVPYRLLRNEPNRLRELLREEGMVVLTSDGKPVALMLNAEDEDLEKLVSTASRIRAQAAVSSLRSAARAQGLDRLTDEEVEREIDAVRAARHADRS
ncbi:MAG: type II toxin-antitoxin system Phd/YefM family antitoxin [Anaerolineae bacterium]